MNRSYLALALLLSGCASPVTYTPTIYTAKQKHEAAAKTQLCPTERNESTKAIALAESTERMSPGERNRRIEYAVSSADKFFSCMSGFLKSRRHEG